jgi:protein TonB
MPLGVPKPPRYPDELRGVGLEGEVKAQFVVDTLGKADLSTFRVISSPHELFSKAVKAALPNMQYSPARLGGRKVRQVVVQPFLLTPGR